MQKMRFKEESFGRTGDAHSLGREQRLLPQLSHRLPGGRGRAGLAPHHPQHHPRYCLWLQLEAVASEYFRSVLIVLLIQLRFPRRLKPGSPLSRAASRRRHCLLREQRHQRRPGRRAVPAPPPGARGGGRAGCGSRAAGGRAAPPPAGPYLVGLEADGGSVSAVGDEMLAVVPEQAVGRGSHQLLRPAGCLLAAQHLVFEESVHVVDQDAAAVGEVLHRVHPDAGRPGDDAQDKPLVGHHLLDLPPVAGDGGQDVGHQVGDAVLAQVNAEVDEEGAGHLQQVSSLEAAGVVVAGRRRWRFPAGARGQWPDVDEEHQLLQQQRGCLWHGVLHRRRGNPRCLRAAPGPRPLFSRLPAGRGGHPGRPTGWGVCGECPPREPARL